MRELIEYPEIIDTDGFRDKSHNSLSVAQSKNLRHYGLYLREKVSGFSELKMDFVRSKSEFITRFRTAAVEDAFLKQLTALQRQIKALLECSFYADEIDNVVTLQAFRLLVGDMMSLFHIMNEGVIRLLSGYFDLPKAEAQRGLAIYKTFATQTTKTVEFFEIARKLRDSLGVEVPKFKHAPLSLAGALEEYLNAPDFAVQQQAFQAKKATSQSRDDIKNPPAVKPQASRDAYQQQQPRAPSPIKSPEVLIDFFASTDVSSSSAIDAYSFNMPTVNTWAPSGMTLSGSGTGFMNNGMPGGGGGGAQFGFPSNASSLVTSPSGNPFGPPPPQQQFMQQQQSGGFASHSGMMGTNGSTQFASASGSSSMNFNSMPANSMQFGQQQQPQQMTAPVDPSFTIDNIFGNTDSGTGGGGAANMNPFGASAANPFGQQQQSAVLQLGPAKNGNGNNPFGSAGANLSTPLAAGNNPFGAPQPPLPNSGGFSSKSANQSFQQQPGMGGMQGGNAFPSSMAPNNPFPTSQSPRMMQQQMQPFGSGMPQQFGANTMQQQQVGGGFMQQPQMGGAGGGFNSTQSFGGAKSGALAGGPSTQVVDHFSGVNPFAKPSIPLAAMQGGGFGSNQTPLYGGNMGMAFNGMNNGMAGMNLNSGTGSAAGSAAGLPPSVQKNSSSNPFFQ
ncbi:hypothetical protein HDU98_000287 [Podochytrium sp. JEL0797]|nr:hypothetical protein HDU98_000287 [Podochytrium sp. JEL0797]